MSITDTLWHSSLFTDQYFDKSRDSLTIEDLQGRLLNYIEDARKSKSDTIFDLHKTEVNDQIVFSATQGVNLFRIVQESINNAIKYASPSKIEVDISLNATEVVFTIIDNGIGFSPEEIDYGHGLKNMELRAKEIGAVFQLNSIKGEGTTIIVRIEKDKLNDV